MTIGRLNVIMGAALGLVGLWLAAAGPAAVGAFGVEMMPAPGADAAVPDAWRLVAFTRMFGAALFLCGAALVAVGGQLAESRARAFAGVMAGAGALAFVLALAQQTALWNTTGGLAIAGVFGVLAIAYGSAAVKPAVA